jgi:hypothetical protein
VPLTDFFVASMPELRVACRGWKDPLPRPVTRPGVNPFTMQPMEILTDAPDPSEGFDTGALERADLAGLHRVDLKGLGTTEMEALVSVALDESEQKTADVYDTPLYGPPTSSAEIILRVPPILVDRLARMEDVALDRCLAQWNTAVGRDMTEYLTSLVTLARMAVSESKQVFMWLCP